MIKVYGAPIDDSDPANRRTRGGMVWNNCIFIWFGAYPFSGVTRGLNHTSRIYPTCHQRNPVVSLRKSVLQRTNCAGTQGLPRSRIPLSRKWGESDLRCEARQ